MVAQSELEHFLRVMLREESGPLRERLLDGLVIHGLTTKNPEHKMDLPTIQRRIGSLTDLPEYPEGLLESTLDRLIFRGDVETVTAGTGTVLYGLAEGVIDPVAENGSHDVDAAMEVSVLRRIVRAFGEIGETEVAIIMDGYRRLVTDVLTTLGYQCAECLLEHKKLEGSSEPLTQVIQARTLALPQELREAAENLYLDCLSSPTKHEAEYLFAVAQVYYLAALLHLDPELQALERGRFEETTLYLDTNVLVAAALAEDPQHRAVSQLLSLCGSLGFRCRYSLRTAQEWDDLLAAADREYGANPPKDRAAASLLANLVDNVFLKSYLISYPVHRMSWSQYRLRLASREKVMGSMGVELEAELEVTGLGARRDHLIRALKAEGRRTRSAEHDSSMVTTIEKAVAEDVVPPHPFGSRYWLLTLDRRLVGVVRRNPAVEVGCTTMPGDEWLQYISPFVSPDVSGLDVATVFADLFSNRVVRSLGGSLGLADLQPFTVPGITELLKDISGDEACRLVASTRMEAVAAHPREWETEAVDILSRRLESKLEEKKARGELTEAAEVERIARGYQEALKHQESLLGERDARLDAMSEELDDAKRALGSSGGLIRRLATNLARTVVSPFRWALRHRWRAAVISVLLAVFLAQGFLLGWSSTVGNYLSGLVLLVVGLALSPLLEKLRKRAR